MLVLLAAASLLACGAEDEGGDASKHSGGAASGGIGGAEAEPDSLGGSAGLGGDPRPFGSCSRWTHEQTRSQGRSKPLCSVR